MLQTRGSLVIDRGQYFTKTFKFRLNGGYDPVDLSTATEIQVSFPKSDGTHHVATLTTYDADARPNSNGQIALVAGTKGDLTITLPSSVTELLKIGAGQHIGVGWTIDSKKTSMTLQKALEVQDAPGI
jgi:hypothetical protein